MAVVFVALTGARRSGGGSCDNDSGSSGSSTSGGSSGHSTSGGSSSGGLSSASPSPTDQDAIGDIKGSRCTYDEVAEELNYDITITNSSAQAYEYTFFVEWQDVADNGLIGIDEHSEPVTVAPGTSETIKAADTYHFTRDNVSYRCNVDWAMKSPAR
ncbi:hypothetical protein OG883_36455 [Streptomyces sp. NBC_01142]|uniref:hypothetical protein n=1 Tax=Streptomyces sp. NBC_01142 TaxID=2975865 RepID=UPI002252EACB|nr:hypothetical protein [Streptomyces sp. NBC_01142]MCX4825258.1 hypothetical protein [Streptomyces sp. NBC_01142]